MCDDWAGNDFGKEIMELVKDSVKEELDDICEHRHQVRRLIEEFAELHSEVGELKQELIWEVGSLKERLEKLEPAVSASATP